MFHPTAEALQTCASQLQDARAKLKTSLGIDRVLMSESRSAIRSSQALLHRIRWQEQANFKRSPSDRA
jgi:hypothetical protein